MGKLAEGLPSSHHTQSLIVCRSTGDIMDADNPPYMLPNCNVYSMAGAQPRARVLRLGWARHSLRCVGRLSGGWQP